MNMQMNKQMNMHEFKLKTILYNDFTIHYYTQGNIANPAILMLHPAFADYTIFQKQFDAFSKDYYLIAIDMVGHGKSQNFKSSVTMGDMPEIIDSILSYEKIPHIHLLGVSLGSLVAQSYAFNYPNRVFSLAAVGGYSIHKANENLLKKQKSEIFKWIYYLIFSLKKFKKYIIANSSYSKESSDVFEKCFETYRRAQFRAMSKMNKLFIHHDKPVPYPLLIINGEHDLPLLLTTNKLWASLEPSGKLHIIPQAGHCANIDNAKVFNKIYADFLMRMSMMDIR
ncbi:MAG: alpha/beta hydrolase [Vallitaleaceae bacterium]|nr:alpha/beta hydrolase [Vallitaleaceae bacterium]